MWPFLIALFVIWLVWFIKSSILPEKFPPGPRFPLPLMGDAYRLGEKMGAGLVEMRRQYGNVVRMFLGPNPTVIIR